MPSPSRRAPADPVLVLRDVALTLWAGRPGCRVAARAFLSLELTVRRGECVAVVGAPPEVGTLLLLVAGGLLQPHAGSVWTLAGALLVRDDVRGARAVRGVAECPSPMRESLRWAPDGAPGAELAIAAGGDLWWATRVLRFAAGRLHAAATAPRRVDSASGAP